MSRRRGRPRGARHLSREDLIAALEEVLAVYDDPGEAIIADELEISRRTLYTYRHIYGLPRGIYLPNAHAYRAVPSSENAEASGA